MKKLVQKAMSVAGVLAVVVAGLVGVLAMAAPRPATVADAGPDSTRVVASHLLGLSGNLRAIEVAPGVVEPAPLARLVPALGSSEPGVHPTGLAAPDGEPITLLSLVPLQAKLGATWRGYRIGFWPGERSTRGRTRYPLPEGFLEVNATDQDLQLSKRFVLGDFLTHDQSAVWPKVLVVRMPLLDKLELIADALQGLGRSDRLRVMSGFRTPQYNAMGVGPLGGRARDSRHMYGDAADVFVDADGNGRMDDLDGDGRVTIADARWLAAVAERVEAEHPGLTGGIGVYRATAAHGPFVHVDVRGSRARW